MGGSFAADLKRFINNTTGELSSVDWSGAVIDVGVKNVDVHIFGNIISCVINNKKHAPVFKHVFRNGCCYTSEDFDQPQIADIEMKVLEILKQKNPDLVKDLGSDGQMVWDSLKGK